MKVLCFSPRRACTGAVLFSFATKGATFAGPTAAGNLVLTADFGGVVRVFGPSYLGPSATTTFAYP